MNTIKSRLTALMVLCFLLGAAVVGRAVQIQLLKDPRLERLARRQFDSKVLIRPRRGAIRDRNGEPLAVNLEIQSLAANPSRIKDKSMLARLLSKSTGVSSSRILRRLRGKGEFAWIKRHLTEQDLGRLKKFKIIDARGDLMDGLWMVQENKRVYPHGELAAHVLGAVNLDSDGIEGMELWADERLRGRVVSVSAIKDALGRPAFIDAVAAKGVRDGENLELTLDASLQFSVEQELQKVVRKTGAQAGSVIVMNSVTGEILAMANEPSFDPNHLNRSSMVNRRNRVITDGFEPGSTMKTLLLSAAFKNGWKLTDRVFGEHGSLVVQGHRITEAESHERHEWIDMKQVLALSSNVASAKIAAKLGAEKYLDVLKLLGLGRKTGIGFPGEISGVLPPAKGMKPLRLANVAFGQGLLVTPMQMIRSYAAIANGGWLVEPTLVKSVMDKHKAKPPERILSDSVVAKTTAALLAVTETGTGRAAVPEGYRIAGKTGTAQTVDTKTGRYSSSRYVASFIGFPVGVNPRLVVFTAIDGPRGSYYAADTAAPLFKGVMNAAVSRFSIPTTEPPVSRKIAKNSKSSSERESALEDKVRWSVAKVAGKVRAESSDDVEWQGTAPDGKLLWKMPALLGMTPREALQALKGHSFQVEMKGFGVVTEQSPPEGKIISDSGRVQLILKDPFPESSQEL